MPISNAADRTPQDPRTVYESPEAVLRSAQLGRQDKRDILERWRRLSRAEAADAGPDLVTRIMRALAFLDVETGEHKDIEGQGLYGAIGDIDADRRPH